MRWLTDSEAQCVEDNLIGFRDSRSLAQFRSVFPSGVFPATVVRLIESGWDADTARWAAGQATMREPEAGVTETVRLAQRILSLRAAA